MRKLVIVTWPDSQMLMGKQGFYENCSLINSERGIDAFGGSAYLVDEDWYTKFCNGELPDDTEEHDDDDELDVCYDDEIIFGEDYDDDGEYDDEEYDDED